MAQDSVRMAVVGAGYFGRLHCQKLLSLPQVQLAAVVDSDPVRAREVADSCRAQALGSIEELGDSIDAAVVATPASSHFAVAAGLLSKGVSVLVEKPLACTLSQAEQLCRLAKERSALVQVGHLERFNPVFIEAARRIRKPRYFRLERCGPFSGRGQDVNVVLDLMTHDLDLLLQLQPAPISSVSGFGQAVVSQHADVVSARIGFADGTVADVFASRVSQRKARWFSVVDAEGVLEADLMGGALSRGRLIDGVFAREEVKVPSADCLQDQDLAFVQALLAKQRPQVDGEAGKAILSLAERILLSIAEPRR